MNMIKVKRLLKKKKNSKPSFLDTNLIHEGSGFLSTALSGLFGCIHCRPHAVKLCFMPEGTLTHKVMGTLWMIRERELAQQVKTLKAHTVWKCCPDASFAASPPQEPLWLCSVVVLCLSRAWDHWPWPKMCQPCLWSLQLFLFFFFSPLAVEG